MRAQDYFDTYDYTYDNNGNILSASKNGETIKTYTYGNANWKDLLTQYNGQTITYDTIGNPLQYRDGMNFTWSNGRQLSTVTNGANSYSYTYNADSLRTAKTVNGTTTNYYWSNGVLQAQKTGDEYLIFLYDENGVAYGFLLKNGTTQEKYYYLFNAQGDVIGLVDSNGSRVVEYYYDAWGNLTYTYGSKASTIGQTNPIRYRGYYYDAETGFYYLQTRYYDPEICRFINADGYVSTGQGVLGNNMFAYCGNNPVNNADYSGNRYCAATTVKNESSYDRAISCGWQRQISIQGNLNKGTTLPIANHVNKSHVTTPTAMVDLGDVFGKVGFSTTTTIENTEPGLFHSYLDIGNDVGKIGAGINVYDWFGLDVGTRTDMSIYFGAQVTPWVHGEAYVGSGKIGIIIGFDIKNTAFDFEISAGWGTALLLLNPQLSSGGQFIKLPSY